MDITRREMTKLVGATAVAAALNSTPLQAATRTAQMPFGPNAWHQRLKRIVQLNLTEHDAANFELDKWIGYLKATKSECTLVSITNAVAFYPTKLPDLPVSRWLNARDILGECTIAAKQAGIRVVGRLSIDMAKAELATRHPDWFMRRKDGSIGSERGAFATQTAEGDPSRTEDFAPTCTFTGYYSEFVPQLIDEVMSRYKLDGVYTNGWPGTHVMPCYCATCQKIGDPYSETYRAAYQKRVFALWELYTQQIARHDRNAIFSGNLGGGIKGGDLDLEPLVARAPWMFADNQGRQLTYSPSWDAAQQNRIASALIDGRPVINSTGAWFFNGPARWRTVNANGPEVRSRMFQTLASGGTVHLHWLGFDQGFHADRRWQAHGLDVLPWQAQNAAHFFNHASLAKVAVVVSPRSNRLYKPAEGTETTESFHGAYKALAEARIPFDVVLDTRLQPDKLLPYDVLILPNVAVLDDGQAAEIAAFVERGGSVLATFETGMYAPDGKERPDSVLGPLLGMRKQGGRIGYGLQPGRGDVYPGANFMQHIAEPGHPVLKGFANTSQIAGGSWRVPIAAALPAALPPALTVIPQYPVYPVEAVFTMQTEFTEPAMVTREVGSARLVYLSGDNEASYWRSSHDDLGTLFVQAVRWLAKDRVPYTVEGSGLLDIYGWQTEPGYALHLVNHTNPNFRGGAFRIPYPVGPQTVRMNLLDAKPVQAARLLRSGTDLPIQQNGDVVTFTIPSINEYEVAALTI